jgi:hypothetical protein
MDLENAKKDLNDAFEQNSKEKKVFEEKIKNSFETIQDLRSQVITLELENKNSQELSVPLAQNLKCMIKKFEQNSPLRKEILKEVSDGIVMEPEIEFILLTHLMILRKQFLPKLIKLVKKILLTL